MINNPNYIEIENLVELIVDNRGKTVPTVSKGIPLIATNCIKHSSIYPTFENIRYINDDTYNNWFRAHLEPNDILFVNKGTPGRSCIIPTPINFVAAQDMVGLRFKKEYHPYYMLAVLRSNEIQQTIKNNYVGLVIPHYRKQELVKLKLPILDKSKRDEIGHLYYILSKKIELNNQINTQLEAMAKTLYDYWFVQFDFPFDFAQGKPKVNGTEAERSRGYKSSGGKMVFDQTLKRELPVGWEVKSLYQIANFINGLACQKFRPENEDDPFLSVIKIREMNDGISGNTEKVRLNIAEKNIINDGDVLFSWSATLDVKIWAEGKAGLNQHIFKVTSDKYPRSFYYFETLNYLQHFKMMAELRKTTMGHITIDHLKASYIPIPPIEMVNMLDDKLKPILEKIISNKKQNQELAQLRDWLLPMLMNGQVRVGSAGYESEEDGLGMVAEEIIYSKSIK